MNRKKLVVVNTFYQLVVRFSSGIFTLITTIYVARYAGIALLAQYSTVIAFVVIFVALSDLGINTRTLKFFDTEAKLKENFKKLLGLRILISLISLIGGLILLVIIGYPKDLNVPIIFGLIAVLINAFLKSFTVIFQVKSDYSNFAKISFIVYLAALAYLGVSSINSVLSIFELVALYLAVQLMIAAGLSYVYRGYLILKGKTFDFAFSKAILSDIWVFAVIMLVNLLMLNLDRLLLAKLSDDANVSVYNTSYRIFEFALIIPTYTMNTYFPLLVLEKESTYQSRLAGTVKSIRYLLVISIFVMAFLLGISYFIPFIWGVELSQGIYALQMLAIGIPFFYITSPLNWFYATEKRYRIMLFAYFAALIINILGNISYIDSLGYVSPILFKIFSEIMVLIIFLYPLLSRTYMTKNAI